MAAMEESSMLLIDDDYEFSAPRFFDFIEGETEEEMRKAELWFDSALSYAPSPFMPKIKASSRSLKLQSLCDFGETEQVQKGSEESESTNTSSNIIMKELTLEAERKEEIVTPNQTKEEQSTCILNQAFADEVKEKIVKTEPLKDISDSTSNTQVVEAEICTPKPAMTTRKTNSIRTDSKKHLTAKKIASIVKNPSILKSKNQAQSSQAKSIKQASARRDLNLVNKVGTPSYVQENQAIKRQKLEGGKTRQILNVKPQNLPHKSRPGLFNTSSSSSIAKTRKEDRKVYAREPATPFVSMAEMMKKFQSNTREMSLSNAETASVTQKKAKLRLTRPKEPEFETAQRVRLVKIKSSAEIEEEMMAKFPKFKARPINKKILEAPTLPALQRSTPQLPEFQEFHLETMARANQNAETSTVASTESFATTQNHQWKPQLTAAKPPVLQTSLRARPPRIKSSEELEKEELEKIPKFKARPLNKKIFESKGDLGISCNTKRQITVPQEFHFATDERIPPPPVNVADMFDKLSLYSEANSEKPMPRNTEPNPFHLHTEERGAEKEKRFMMEVLHKQIEEERARIPKANPYPYTTDYPVLPPKPEPKQCTKPEPFELESLVRHEEEVQREMEERLRMEREEAQMRKFKAQPILKEDPIPVPEKVRKPLTQVEKFNLHADHRAVDRAEFDKKIKEKEMMYKRYREEAESEKMMEEEKALKQLRRTLVPHARPVPSFNRPFLPQKSSKEVTKPKSPKLKVLQRRKERREMIHAVSAATSSPATYMR